MIQSKIDPPQLRREAPAVRCRRDGPAWRHWARLPPRGRGPREAKRAEHAEQAAEKVVEAPATGGRSTSSPTAPRGWSGRDHDDARGERDGDQGLLLLPSAARPPRAGTRPASRGGFHHAPATGAQRRPRPFPPPLPNDSLAPPGDRRQGSSLPAVVGAGEEMGVGLRGLGEAGAHGTGWELLINPTKDVD